MQNCHSHTGLVHIPKIIFNFHGRGGGGGIDRIGPSHSWIPAIGRGTMVTREMWLAIIEFTEQHRRTGSYKHRAGNKYLRTNSAFEDSLSSLHQLLFIDWLTQLIRILHTMGLCCPTMGFYGVLVFLLWYSSLFGRIKVGAVENKPGKWTI